MANPLSDLGIVHTVISLAPVAAGAWAFWKYGAILPRTRSGVIYIASLVLSVVTSFGLSSTGGFNPGHAIGILSLLAVAFSFAVERSGRFGGWTPYLTTLGLSGSFFLLMVPGINETLSRLPPSSPIGNGPNSPEVLTATVIWLVIFTAGLGFQLWRLRGTGQSGRWAV